MRDSRSQLLGTFVLIVCLVCRILEVFDTWDPAIELGNDTEYALVIAALCVGAAYLFVRATVEFFRESPVSALTLASGLLTLFISRRRFDFGFSDTSPPALYESRLRSVANRNPVRVGGCSKTVVVSPKPKLPRGGENCENTNSGSSS